MMHMNLMFLTPRALIWVMASMAEPPGGQHGIQNDHFTVGDIVGELAVVFHRLCGFGVTVQANVSHLSSRNQLHYAVHHAQTSTQDRYKGQLAAGDHLGLGDSHGGFDLHFLEGEIPGWLRSRAAW